MKKSFAASALLASALFAGNAAAETVELKGCTKDGQTATVSVHAVGTIGNEALKDTAQRAFSNAAKTLTADELKSPEGYSIFASNLIAEAGHKELSADAEFGTLAMPQTGAPSCKP